jgi:hypothetical protein
MLRKILAKLGEGLLLGIGAGIAFGAFSYVQARIMMSQLEERAYGDELPSFEGYREFGPEAKLSITSQKPQPGNERTTFIGEISNDGKDAWDYVRLMVELFDKDNVFVGKCTGSVDGTIRSGEKRNFEVSCTSCGNSVVPAYDHYTIQIVDANFASEAK